MSASPCKLHRPRDHRDLHSLWQPPKVTSISWTNSSGLHIAIYQDYLLLCSYLLCSEIYSQRHRQPAPCPCIWAKNHVARKQRDSMPVVPRFLWHDNCGYGWSIRINMKSIVKVFSPSPPSLHSPHNLHMHPSRIHSMCTTSRTIGSMPTALNDVVNTLNLTSLMACSALSNISWHWDQYEFK